MTAVYAGQASGGGTTGTTDRTATFGAAAAGELLVVICNVSVNTNATPTCSDSLGGTYTFVRAQTWNTSANTLSMFVRNQPMNSTAGGTITVATGANDAGVVGVIRVSGMQRFGAAAIRQSGGADNGASAATPAFTFGASCLTTNVTIVAVGSGDTTTTPPASWTERIEANQATPTTALEVATRDSGFTGTTVTWGATAGAVWAAIGIELDCSAPSLIGDYPASASAMNTACGGGTWTAAYRCNESSGNLSPQFGSGDLTATGLAYSASGMIAGETAVQFTGGGTDNAAGGTIHNPSTNDLVYLIAVKLTARTANCVIAQRLAGDAGWRISENAGGTGLEIKFFTSGTNSDDTLTYGGSAEWAVIVHVVDRAASLARTALYAPSIGYVASAGVATDANSLAGTGNDFRIGGGGGSNTSAMDVDFVCVGVGSGAAGSMSANIVTRLYSFMAALEVAASGAANLLLLGVG